MKPRIEKIGKRRVKDIDLGGENLNYRYYDELGNTLESFSLDGAGVNHLESFLKTKLRKFINVDVIDVECIDYLGGVKTCSLKEVKDSDFSGYHNSHEFMEDAIDDFIEQKILGALNTKKVNLRLRGDKILFTGGGSVLLKPYLETALENNKENLVFSDTAYWDNCISYVIKDIADRCKALPGDKTANKAIAQSAANKILKGTNFKDS
jgi:plasmid segregation protein ParM